MLFVSVFVSMNTILRLARLTRDDKNFSGNIWKILYKRGILAAEDTHLLLVL